MSARNKVLAKRIFARQKQLLDVRRNGGARLLVSSSQSVTKTNVPVIPHAQLSESKLAHPLGLSTGELIPRPCNAGPASSADFMRRTLTNVTTLAWNSVQASTRDQYSVPWNHWLLWASEFGTDRFLRVIPTFWSLAVAAEYSFGFTVAAMLSFVAYLFGDLKLKPCTVTSYISGVKFVLQMSGIDTRFVDDDPTYRRVTSGCCLAYRSTHPEYDDKTMPFTVEMILAAQKFSDQTSIEGYMTVSAMKMAYCCLMRRSEYLLLPKTNHHLRGKCVSFVHHLPDGSRVTVDSSKAFSCGLSVETLYEIVVDILSAKNDKVGEGHRRTFRRIGKADQPVGHAFDLAEDMWKYSIWARPTLDGPFFVYRSSIKLSYDTLVMRMKSTARRLGFNQAFFSSHSLRIGGASALAAAGVPDYIIQTFGRWKSLAFLKYIRLASAAFDAALSKMCNTNTLTVSDLCRITTAVPGAVNA